MQAHRPDKHVADALARIERAERVLEDHLDAPAQRQVGHRFDVHPVQQDAPRIRPLQPQQQPAKGDLPHPDSPTTASVRP